jgi:adenosine deaminase
VSDKLNSLPVEYGVQPVYEPLPAAFAHDMLARRIPKAELHCHLQGALRPSQFHRGLEQFRKLRISRAEADSAFDFVSFDKFFADLNVVCSLWGSGSAITLAVLDILAGAYDLGCRHVELMITPDLHRKFGLEPEALLRAAGEAFTIAAGTWGLTGGIIVEMMRDMGKDTAMALVRETVSLRAKGVPILGYGNEGDHRKTPFEELIPAYKIAREEGFCLCGHAACLHDVAGSLDMKFDRIDHGFFCAAEPELLDRVANSGTPLTLCPSSAVLACGAAFLEAFKRIHKAGVPICICADDPPLWFTDIAQEYSSMARAMNWTAAEMGYFAKSSLNAAWLPAGSEDSRAGWLSDIDAYVSDVRHPKRS